MSSIRGDHYCVVAHKGRILFPAKLKKQMSLQTGEVVIGKMNIFEKSLKLYPESAWELLVKQTLKRLNPYNAKHDQFRRNFFRGVVEIELDGTGRIVIPRRFLDELGVEAGKKQEVVLSGQGDYVECMAAARYDSTEPSVQEQQSLSEEVMDGFEWGDED